MRQDNRQLYTRKTTKPRFIARNKANNPILRLHIHHGQHSMAILLIRNYTPPSQFQTQSPVPPLPPYRPSQNGGFPWKGTLIILCIALPIMFAIFFLIINHPGLKSTPSKIGDTITVNGVSCTVISTQDPTNLTAGFSMVDVKIVNNSNQEINYYATDFSVVTTNGNIIDASSSGSSLQMVSGSLAPGGSIEGNIGFALFDTQVTKMIWQPSGTTDLSYAWYIKF